MKLTWFFAAARMSKSEPFQVSHELKAETTMSSA